MGKPEARIRRLAKFRVNEGSARKNSLSIRRLLHDLVSEEFENDANRCADALSEHLQKRNRRERRAFRVGFSGETLYKIATDRQTISFSQLDAIALHYGVPLALLLLFTRVRSEIETSQGPRSLEATRMLQGFISALQFLDAKLAAAGEGEPVYDHLNHSTLLEYIDSYRDKFDEIFI